MKVCIVGDVHGRDVWKKIDFGKYDHVVFMGDYFDPYMGHVSYDDRLDNFEVIVNLKGREPEKYTLLFGNHDFHYLEMTNGLWAQHYSRYDGTFASVYPVAEMFKVGLEAGTLQIAYRIPGTNFVFTHAGLSVTWYNQHILGRPVDSKEDLYPTVSDIDMLVAKLNTLPIEEYAFVDIYWDSYGFSPFQGPLWWRVETRSGEGFQEDEILEGIVQVNGHTQQWHLKELPGRVVLVDILGQGRYVELDTETGKFTEQQIDLTEKELKKLR